MTRERSAHCISMNLTVVGRIYVALYKWDDAIDVFLYTIMQLMHCDKIMYIHRVCANCALCFTIGV